MNAAGRFARIRDLVKHKSEGQWNGCSGITKSWKEVRRCITKDTRSVFRLLPHSNPVYTPSCLVTAFLCYYTIKSLLSSKLKHIQFTSQLISILYILIACSYLCVDFPSRLSYWDLTKILYVFLVSSMRISYPVSSFVNYPDSSIRVYIQCLDLHQKVTLMNSLWKARLKWTHNGKSMVASVSTQKQLEGFRRNLIW